GVVFFFFQAEDGIRDATVTGVQTCALPISPRTLELELLLATNDPEAAVASGRELLAAERDADVIARAKHLVAYALLRLAQPIEEIGRASCRERGEDEEVGGPRKRERAKVLR